MAVILEVLRKLPSVIFLVLLHIPRHRIKKCYFIVFVSIKDRSKIMIKTIVKIDGMMCSMCEAHISDVIRKTVPGAKKVAASRAKGEASFLTEGAVDEAALKEAVAATGYTCLSVESAPYEKKGWFFG